MNAFRNLSRHGPSTHDLCRRRLTTALSQLCKARNEPTMTLHQIPHSNSLTMTYDDPEQSLQDQGLEVVVVPYRPAPLTIDAPSKMQSKQQLQQPTPEFMNHPPRQLYTPRSQLAMVEAVCQGDVGGESSEKMPQHPLHRSQSDSSKKKLTVDVASTPVREKKRPPSRSVSLPTHNRSPSHNRSSASQTARQHSRHEQQSQKQKPKHRRKLSYLQLARLGYQELVHAIIRPPRSTYSTEALGPEEFDFCETKIQRKDFVVWNKRRMRLCCSLWGSGWKLDDFGSYNGNDIDGNNSIGCGDDGVDEGNANDSEEEPDFNGRVVLDNWDEANERGRMYLQLNEDTLQMGSDDYSSDSSSDSSSDGVNVYKNKEDTPTASLSFSQCTVSPQAPSDHSDSSTPQQASSTSKPKKHPVVIYLHGNSSSRLEVIPQLGHLLSLGLSVLSFDFSGSGQSDGEYVSLGYHEREDLDSVISFLRSTNQVSSISLWGRSMGAATALMYASRDPTISCMILDSPFTDLHTLIEEMVEKGRKQGVIVPSLLLSVVMKMIKSSVKASANFSLRHISPISHVDKCFVPALFVAGEHDDFIHKSHSINLHSKYAGENNLAIVDGDHNSPRPRFLLHQACLFLKICMELEGELDVKRGINLCIPPWLLGGAKGLTPRDGGRNERRGPLRYGEMNCRNGKQRQLRESMERMKRQPSVQVLEPKERDNFKQIEVDSTKINESNHSQDQVLLLKEDEAEEVLAAAAPPDMNVRQKDIQSSLFKLLGQSES